VDLALIPSLAIIVYAAAAGVDGAAKLTGCSRLDPDSQTTRPLPDAAHKRDLLTAANVRRTESS
jgi:hypothetical protein